MPIVHLTGATSTLHELYALPLLAGAHGDSLQSDQQHTLPPQGKEYKKKFIVYRATPLPTQDFKEEFSEDGSSRWRMEKWNEFRSRKLNSLVISIALHEMNRIRREGNTFTEEQIRELCFEKLTPQFFEKHELDYPVDGYTAAMDGDTKAYTWGAAQRTVQSAVVYAFEVWDYQKDVDMRKRASEAGKAYSVFDDVEAYMSVRHMKQAPAARTLGRSRTTVQKMFKHFKGMTDEQLAELVELVTVDPATGELRGEQETTPTPDGDESVESDRVRSEAGDQPRPATGELAPALTYRRTGSYSRAPFPSAVDDQAGGILRKLDGISLPF